MKELNERTLDLKLIMSIMATGLMSFTGVVIETAMNVTFPTLMEEFQVGTSTVQWITTAYLLVLAIVIPASSFLKKRFTNKFLFLTAIILFIAGTLLSAASPTFGMLLAGRIIQGIGTGISLPLMFNIVLEQAPLDKMGMLMGVASLITAMAPAVGPSVGGLIVNTFGWRMIFISLLPVLIAALFMGIFSIRSVETEAVRFDWIGYVFLSLSFTALILATSLAGTRSFRSVTVILLLITSLFLLFCFCRHSKKTLVPIIDLSVFHNRSFTFSVAVLLQIQFIVLGLGFLVPNYSQLVSGKDPFFAGCLLLPGCLLGAFFPPLSGRLLDKFGARKPILTGILLIILSTLCFSIFARKMTSVLFIIFYIFFALGQGFTSGNTMTNGLKHLSENLKPDGNAVNNTIQQLAGAVGTSIVTTLVSSVQAKMPESLAIATLEGSRNAFILLFILALGALFCSLCVFYYSKE